MKKLMFAAAVAAMSGATFAGDMAAQVYDVAFTIKTTKAVQAKKINNKTNPVRVTATTAEDFVYRTQTSVTWKGLIWGCNCESIDGVWENVVDCNGNVGKTIKGMIIWDVKGKAPVSIGDESYDIVTDGKVNEDAIVDYITQANGWGNSGWDWTFLQLINKDAKQAECYWDMGYYLTDPCDPAGAMYTAWDFYGAGFGTVSLATTYDKDTRLYDVDCNSYVSSISGNFAGSMLAPTLKTSTSYGCSFCGGGKNLTCDFADAWAWCEFTDCNCDLNTDCFTQTAAYGTWSIKYNASLSKKLTNAESILDVYNFKSLPLVKKTIEIAEEAANSFQGAYTAAKQAVADAEKAVADAEKVLEDAEKALEDAEKAKAVADQVVTVAQAAQTAWNIDNTSTDYAIKANNYFNLTGKTFVGTTGSDNSVTVALADQATAAAALTAAQNAKADAEDDLDDAKDDLDDAKDELEAAEADCEEAGVDCK